MSKSNPVNCICYCTLTDLDDTSGSRDVLYKVGVHVVVTQDSKGNVIEMLAG